MATVGQQLSAPEATWQRIQSTSAYITYLGTWTDYTATGASGGSYRYDSQTGKSIIFKFNGTKLRLISLITSSNYASGNKVYIDGVQRGTFTLVNATTIQSALVYEITGLSSGLHTVELEKGTGTYMNLDAIDIDSTGSMFYETLTQQLTAGEGWKRLDYSSTYINFPGSSSSATASAYNGSFQYNTANTAVIKFTFLGSKIRLIGTASTSTSYTRLSEVFIDGVSQGTFSVYTPIASQYYSVFKEITGLEFTTHEVTINVFTGYTGGLNFDCIDIDTTGEYTYNQGAILTSPQSGWRRYDNSNELICYSGDWRTELAQAGTYGGTYKLTTYNVATANGSYYDIGFTGTKIRLITFTWSTASTIIDVYIDGVLDKTFSMVGADQFIASGNAYQVLTYQKLGLTDGYHQIRVVNRTDLYLSLDAVDIDSSKELVACNSLPIKTDMYNMEIGDCIPCTYVAGTAGAAGTFYDLGVLGNTYLPISSESTSNGVFYFIKADRGLLIADRNIQSATTWSNLNSNKYIEGMTYKETNIGKFTSIIYVATTGSDTNSGSPSYPVLSISKAMELSKVDGVIIFGSGTFAAGTIELAELLTTKNLTYIGQGNATTITFSICTQTYSMLASVQAFFYNLKFTVNATFGASSGEKRFLFYPAGSTDYKMRFYNCAFDGYLHTNSVIYPSSSYFVWSASAAVNRDVYFTNCSFNNKPAEGNGSTANRYVNCVFNTTYSNYDTGTILNSGAPLTSKYAMNFGASFNLLGSTSTWANQGTGTDPDGSVADIGVYGGTYAWATASWSQWELTTLKKYKIRSMTGGHAYATENGTMALSDQGEGGYYTDNEFDKYIRNSTLNGRIQASASHVWGYALQETYYGSWTTDTPHVNIVASSNKFVRPRSLSRLFNGTSSRANFNAVIIPTGSKTIQFEFDCSAIPTTARYVFTTAVKNESGNRIACYIAPTTDTVNAGKLVVTIDKGTGGASETIVVRGITSASLCDGLWYRVKFVFNDTTRKLSTFVNDVLDNEVNYETGQFDDTGYLRNLLLGANYATSTTYSGYLSGLLDNFRVYNSQNVLVLNCPMNEASSATNVTDTSGNGYIGTVTSLSLASKADSSGMYPFTASSASANVVSGFRPVIEFEE